MKYIQLTRIEEHYYVIVFTNKFIVNNNQKQALTSDSPSIDKNCSSSECSLKRGEFLACMVAMKTQTTIIPIFTFTFDCFLDQ